MLPSGKPEYTGAVDVVVTVVRRDGLRALWRGFLPFYARLGPHTTLSLMLLEQLRRAHREWGER